MTEQPEEHPVRKRTPPLGNKKIIPLFSRGVPAGRGVTFPVNSAVLSVIKIKTSK